MVRTNFPIKYLGLPLAVRRLRKIDFQPLVDKATSNISGWQGRHFTQAERICLTKFVLSSQQVYLLTAMKAPTAILDDIDKSTEKIPLGGRLDTHGRKVQS